MTKGIDEDYSEEEENLGQNGEVKESIEETPLEPTIKLTELATKDLEKIIKIYDAIRDVKRRKDPNKEKLLRQELDKKMPKVAFILKEAMQEEVSDKLRNAAILKVKGELLGMAFDKMIEEIGDKVSVEVWKSIKVNYDNVIKEFLSNLEYSKEPQVQESSRQSEAEIQGLMQVIQTLEDELKTVNDKLQTTQRAYEEEKNKLLERIATLEEECKKPFKKYEIISKALPEPVKEIKRYTYLYSNTKCMPLGQLKDTIFDIYQQKIKYDEKSVANCQAKETMEQYMYTYLNQVYGLKSLIIEASSGIIQGIKKYSIVDSDVALFGKILRNECDEGFRFVFAEIKAAMATVLKDKLKQKYKSKTEAELNKMVKEMQQTEITEKYWSAIIMKMYNEEHFHILSKRIKEKIEEKRKNMKVEGKKVTREEINQMQSKQTNKIQYTDLQKIILDFQLAKHENYLKKFTTLFKEMDTRREGILKEAEFRQLINRMEIPVTEKDIQRFLQRVDPYNNQKITYSECLALFSSVVFIPKCRKCWRWR